MGISYTEEQLWRPPGSMRVNPRPSGFARSHSDPTLCIEFARAPPPPPPAHDPYAGAATSSAGNAEPEQFRVHSDYEEEEIFDTEMESNDDWNQAEYEQIFGPDEDF